MDDLISRQALYEILDEYDEGKIYWGEAEDRIGNLPSAQPENTCEKTCEITRMSQEKDTIYRQDVIDMIQGVPISSGTTKAMLIFRAKELPSALPEPYKGETK